jgi:hypothetical protein
MNNYLPGAELKDAGWKMELSVYALSWNWKLELELSIWKFPVAAWRHLCNSSSTNDNTLHHQTVPPEILSLY